MKKIDIQNFDKYYLNVDGNATVARVGHVNAVIDAVSNDLNPSLIDPTLNGGVNVYTQFEKNELISKITPTGQLLEGYKLLVSANLNDPSTSSYLLFLGTIKKAAGTTLALAGVSGAIVADASFFAPTSIVSAYAAGAEVNDPAGPGLYQLNIAEAVLQGNPFDPTETALLAYLDCSSDFNAEISIQIDLYVTNGATINYSQD